jgi:glycosyltransferase involved in cell wall biosynthesis
MKIVHIIPSLGNGGAERFVIDLTNEHSKRHTTFLVSFKEVNEKMLFIPDISSDVHLVTLNKKKGFDLKFLLRLIKFIFKEKPDIVNTHLSAINYFFPIIFLFSRIKYFHTIHCIAQIEEKRKLFRLIRQFYFKNMFIIPICLTNEIKISFNKIYDSSESVVILNGVNEIKKSEYFEDVRKEIEVYKMNKHTKVFIIVARFFEQKNLIMIAKVFKQLSNEKRNVILLMVGEDPSYGKEIWNEVLKIKSQNTFLLGSIANVGDYMICSDAFCLSSLYEGMPITILEAYSAGIPVISTPVGGVPDILADNENGILSQDITEESYYKAINRFLKMKDEVIKLIKRKNKLDFSNKYKIEIAAKNYEELYLSNSPRRGN